MNPFHIIEYVFSDGRKEYGVQNKNTGATWGAWSDIETAKEEIICCMRSPRIIEKNIIEYPAAGAPS